MEMLARNSIEPTHVPFGLVPEILDAIDMRALMDEAVLVVDTLVLEAGHVEHVISRETVCKYDGIWLDALLDDGQQRSTSSIWDDHRVDLSSALEEAEDGDLACRAATAFSFAAPTEVTLVDFDLTRHE